MVAVDAACVVDVMEVNRALEEHYYSLLGTVPGTSFEECEKCYRQRMIELHPDRYAIDDPKRKVAEEKAKQLAEALERIRVWKSQSRQAVKEREQRIRNEKLGGLDVQVRVVKK